MRDNGRTLSKKSAEEISTNRMRGINWFKVFFNAL